VEGTEDIGEYSTCITTPFSESAAMSVLLPTQKEGAVMGGLDSAVSVPIPTQKGRNPYGWFRLGEPFSQV